VYYKQNTSITNSKDNLEKELADKFFGNRCTPEEAEKVLDWLETPDGQNYLDEKIEKEFNKIDKDEKTLNSQQINSEKIFSKVINRINRLEFAKNKISFFAKPYLQVAAGIILLLGVSLIYFLNQESVISSEDFGDIHFTTAADEKREVRLGDGTKIWINSNSKLTISSEYLNKSRMVSLEGEAFFEVAQRKDDPFIVKVNASEVEVLGTSFNVNSRRGENRVEVSVTSGRVAFSGIADYEYSRVILQQGDYANWDSSLQIMTIENYGAENYISWVTGEFVFDNMPLNEVCIQLYNIHDLSCEFKDGSISELKLVANIPDTSLENTLSVIALSLKLQYEIIDNKVFWDLEN
jgi:transmembrane sensor